MPQSAQSSLPWCSLLTATGTGAVATIRYRGDYERLERSQAGFFRSANGMSIAESEFGRVLYGSWGTSVTEDVVICRIDQNTLEIHCHGGAAAVSRILADLEQLGCRQQSAWQALAEEAEELELELQSVLSQCQTLQTARWVIRQSDGRLAEAVRPFAGSPTDAGDESLETAQDELDQLLRYSQFGLHLTQPWKVVVAGRPNVGKSSLINALVGFQRSIVLDQPGTTRDVLTAHTVLDGWPIELIDTAGIHESDEPIEVEGIKRAQSLLSESDAILLVLDRSQPLRPEDDRLMADIPPEKKLLVANKCDLESAWNHETFEQTIPVSAQNASGLDRLTTRLLEQLLPDQPDESAAFPVTRRQVNLLLSMREACRQRRTSELQSAAREFLAGRD